MNKSLKRAFVIALISGLFFAIVAITRLYNPKLLPRIKRKINQIVKHEIPPNLPKRLQHFKIIGIDVSHYQGEIDWNQVKTIDKRPISFVVIRATQGDDGDDSRFKRNWDAVKEKGLIRGAYHYYRPNENSIKQADNFIKKVKLSKGDLPPILDIEKFSRIQSRRSLRIGLKKWLDKVELHYGVKPIIYTGASHYKDLLNNETFAEYILWVANYNDVEKPFRKEIDWKFWQYRDWGRVKGIKGEVDLNVFNGDKLKLQKLLIFD
jgi:lysozyme